MMKKNEAIARLLRKSDLEPQEKEIIREALTALTKAKELTASLTQKADREIPQSSMKASINDSIAYLCMVAVPPEQVIGREINSLTGISTENVGS